LDQIADVGVNVSRCLKLFAHGIIFEVFQPPGSNLCEKHTSTSQTDGRLSRLTLA